MSSINCNWRILLVALLAVTFLTFAQQSGGSPTTGSGSSGSSGSGSSGSTTPRAPTTGTTTSTTPNRPSDLNMDPFGSTNAGIQGRLVPNPGQRLTVDLFQDGIRMDTAFSDSDGTFKFSRQQFSNRRYEIHVMLGPDTEYQEEVDFQP